MGEDRHVAGDGTRFDAVLFDAGGVLVLPDPTVLGPLLAYFGGDAGIDAHRRAHYAGMKAKSDVSAAEASWDVYNHAYIATVGVDERSDEIGCFDYALRPVVRPA